MPSTSPPYFSDAPPRPGAFAPFDWSERLSIKALRDHTKTDDVPGVTDEQLKLYRAAAIEAAEAYTGLLLAGQRTVTEPIERPSRAQRTKASSQYYEMPNYGAPSRHGFTYPVTLQYPPADGIVYLYGGSHPSDNRGFTVRPGARTIHVPIRTGFIDMSNCCDPCARPHHYNDGMFAVYKAGYACVDDVPAAVVLGCMQYIAWAVEHPGDELLTQRNRMDRSTGGGGLTGSNNIAHVSGAIESWRILDPEAI